MIPIFAKLAAPAAKAALKAFLGDNLKKVLIISAVAGVALLVAGFYRHWENTIYSDGVNDTIAKYLERDLRADKKAQSIIDLKNFEIERIKKERDNVYVSAVTTYSKEIELLNFRVNNLASKRMSVTAKKPQACRNELSTETGNKQADNRSGFGVFEVEIESETAKDIREIINNVGYGEAACAQLVEAVKQEFVIK